MKRRQSDYNLKKCGVKKEEMQTVLLLKKLYTAQLLFLARINNKNGACKKRSSL